MAKGPASMLLSAFSGDHGAVAGHSGGFEAGGEERKWLGRGKCVLMWTIPQPTVANRTTALNAVRKTGRFFLQPVATDD